MDSTRLGFVYDGWDGYHRSIVAAIKPLDTAHLAYRIHPEARSLGETAWHIAHGRVDWFRRMQAPLGAELWEAIGHRPSPNNAGAEEICEWLDRTWTMVETTLEQWGVRDLEKTFEHAYAGKVYAISYQWVVWRILTHDVHHGGQISAMLAAQGIYPTELTMQGGHLTLPPIVS